MSADCRRMKLRHAVESFSDEVRVTKKILLLGWLFALNFQMLFRNGTSRRVFE